MRSSAFGKQQSSVTPARLCFAVVAVGALFGCRIGEGDIAPRTGNAAGGSGGRGAADQGPSGAAGSARVKSSGGATGTNPDGGVAGMGDASSASACKVGDTRCFGIGLSACTPAGGWGPILMCGTNLACATRAGAGACVGTTDGVAHVTGTVDRREAKVRRHVRERRRPRNRAPAQLLTDGRVLASGPEGATDWYRFTPDAFGSYENGTWAPAATAPVGRIFHPSFVLRDGRYWSGGGEYVTATTRAANEVYDPVADAWSSLPDMPEDMADTPAAILGDGRLLVLSHRWASTNTYVLTFGSVPTWSLTAPWSYAIGDQESTSTTLQDGSALLAGLHLFALYVPSTGVRIQPRPRPRRRRRVRAAQQRRDGPHPRAPRRPRVRARREREERHLHAGRSGRRRLVGAGRRHALDVQSQRRALGRRAERQGALGGHERRWRRRHR